MQKPAIGDASFGEAYRDLVEAAIRNEAAISTAIGNMETATRNMRKAEEMLREKVRTLPDWVTGEVDKRIEKIVHNTAAQITNNLAAVNEAARRLQVQYENAAKFGVKRMAVACFGSGCIGMIIAMYVAAWLILPAPDVLQREREAEQNVEKLAPLGGNSILSMCKTAQGERRCVRTDERGQQMPFGVGGGETYRIIYGY
jgi:hypothetical protein